MFIKKIFNLSENINLRIYILLLLFEIKVIYSINSAKKISAYRDESLSLDNENPMKLYYYLNTKFQQEKNYDIILQFKNILKVASDIEIYVYTSNTYIYNMDNLIKKNDTTNELMNYQKKFELNSTNENYSEYSLTQKDFDENINITFYQYYYILFVKGNNNNNFKSTFLIFNTLDIIESYPNDFSNQIYYRYENNYNINNYIFKINTKSGFNKNLNIQFLSYYENSLFNLEVYKKINGNDTRIYSLQNFNILDHAIPVNDTQLLYINLSFIQKHEKGSRRDPFSIFFEISNSFNYLNIQKVPEKSTCFTFMAKKEIYFYFVIKNNTSGNGFNNQDYFYILQSLSNDEIPIIGNYNYFILEYFIAKEKEYYDENDINNDEINDLIINNKENFIKLNSIYDQDKSLYFYKVNINNKNNKNIDNKLMIIKMYLNDNNIENKLKTKSINFRYLPLILLTDEIYNYNSSYIAYYKSNNYIDKIGYYYIPIRNLQSNKILYCPYENTMTLYFGELDISKNFILPSLENQKIYIINPNNSTLFNGITIFTVNKISNYFLQYGDIDENILSNININNYRSNENMNKEIKINDNIKELYYFNMYYFNDSFIIDISVIFGNVSMEYLSLDSLSDYDKNLYNIFPLNKQYLNKYIKTINCPVLVETSNIEIIRIINNNYSLKNGSSNNYNKSLFYINKYKVYSEVEENKLIPLFISSGDIFSKFKINTNLLNVEIKYKFFLNDRNPLNKDSKEYNISLSLNNETFYLAGIGENSFHTGTVNLAKFNQIRVTNICNKNILFWVQLGSFVENDYEIFYASQKPYNGMMSTSKIYLFVFDFINILNKKDIGLYPYKFVFNFEKPNSSKCNGYYRQSLVNKNVDSLNLIFIPTSINSIYYDITTSENIISIDDDLNLEELDYILNRNKHLYLNTIIRPIIGYLRVNFYMEYKYELTDKKNELASFDFDESIYSIRYKLADANKNKYLLFQVLSCNYYKDFNVLFFKENSNISYSLFKNYDNSKIGNISQENIYGYINLENIYEEKDSIFLGVVRPGKLFVRYTYTNSKIDANFINSLYEENKFQYNINIEKIRKVENKDVFSISFEPFLKNAITNYFILTLNEKENDIINECQFLSYLYNYKNKNKVFSVDSISNTKDNIFINSLDYKKYISFKDEGISDRISRELTFETFGNYKIYILAEELESYSLYKLLGVKTYSYVNDGNEMVEEEDENEVSWILIMLIIVLSLLIIILSAFIIYHQMRKENINQIIKFMNLPKSDSANLSKNNLLLSINKNEDLNDSNNNLLFPILNNSEYKENNSQEDNNIKNENINKNNNEDNNMEIDEEEKSEPPPPAITAYPNENSISEMLEEIKHKDSDKKIDEENMYTNAGTDLTDQGTSKEE